MTSVYIETDCTSIDAGSVSSTLTNRPRLLFIPDIHGEKSEVICGAALRGAAFYKALGFDVVIAEQSANDITAEQIAQQDPNAILVYSQHRSNGKGANELGVNRIRDILAGQSLPYAVIGADHVSYLGKNQLVHDSSDADNTRNAVAAYLRSRTSGGLDHTKAWIAAQPVASGAMRC